MPVVSNPDVEGHANYSSVDEGPASASEVERLLATGFVASARSWDELLRKLGGKPHFSKLGVIAKEKEGRLKRRLNLDCKESGVNRKARKGGGLVLPRVTDIVDEALFLMNEARAGQEIEWPILDFTDCFFNIPFNPLERKHFLIKNKDAFIYCLAQAQGSVNAPVACGAWLRSWPD